MKYKAKMHMSDEELNLYYDLLRIEDLECEDEHTLDRLGAMQDDEIFIRRLNFENGNYIMLYLNSGSTNYYTNMILYDEDDEELTCDDNFELSNFIVDYDDDTYIVEQ